MGNSSNQRLKQYLEEYDITSKNQQEGILYLTSKEFKKDYFMKQIYSSMGAEKWNLETLLRQRMQYSHQHIIFPHDYLINSERKESSEPAAWVLYSSHMNNMKQQKQQRIKAGCSFTTEQLWSILASIIIANSYLESLNIRNQSLRTHNIYIRNDGSLLILDPLCNELNTNYRMHKQNRDKRFAFISPKQMQSLNNNKRYPIHNSYKSSVFIAGLIIIELALLRELDLNYSNGFEDKIDQFIKQLEIKYPKQLVIFIKQMVKFDQDKRMNWIMLEQYAQKDILTSQSRVKGLSQVSNKVHCVTENNLKQSLIIKSNYAPKSLTNFSLHISNRKETSPILRHPTRQKSKYIFSPRIDTTSDVLSSKQQRSRALTFRSIKSDQSNQIVKRVCFGSPQNRIDKAKQISAVTINPIIKYQNQRFHHQSLNKNPIKQPSKSVKKHLVQSQNHQILNKNYRIVNKIDYLNFDPFHDCWILYTGQLINGQRHGKGRLLFCDSSMYEGNFLNNKMHGSGKYLTTTLCIKGYWNNNKLQSVMK